MDVFVELKALIGDFTAKMGLVRGEMEKTSKAGGTLEGPPHMTLAPAVIAKALTVLAAGLASAVAAGLIVGPTAAWVTIAVTALTTIAVYLVPNRGA